MNRDLRTGSSVSVAGYGYKKSWWTQTSSSVIVTNNMHPSIPFTGLTCGTSWANTRRTWSAPARSALKWTPWTTTAPSSVSTARKYPSRRRRRWSGERYKWYRPRCTGPCGSRTSHRTPWIFTGRWSRPRSLTGKPTTTSTGTTSFTIWCGPSTTWSPTLHRILKVNTLEVSIKVNVLCMLSVLDKTIRNR